jgi:hypothetical protein
LDPQLERIDAKLNALLAIIVDRYLRETETARPKKRSIDRLLSDAGLSATETAKLLGKTDRAVRLQLQREGQSKRKGGEADDDGET